MWPLALVLVVGLLPHAVVTAGPAAAAPDGVTARMSVGTEGQQANDESGPPTISADGRYVAFASRAGLPVALDPQPPRDDSWQVYVRDRRAPGRTLWVSHPAEDVSPTDVSISGDGRFVAFTTRSRLAREDRDFGDRDVYVHDRDPDDNGSFDDERRTTLVTHPDSGLSAFEPVTEPAFADDGRSIGYTVRHSPTHGDVSAWTATVDPESGRFADWEGRTRFIDFGEPADSQHRVIYLRNLSPEPRPLDDIRIAGLHQLAFTISDNDCPEVLEPGAACGLVVSFNRLFPPGVYHALLQTGSADRLARTSVALAATQRCPLGEDVACHRAPLEASTGGLMFDDTDRQDAKKLTVTIANRSTDRAVIAAVLIKGQRSTWFRPTSDSTCRPGTILTGVPESLPELPVIDELPVVAGSECRLTIRFSPRRMGVGNATLIVKTSAGLVQPIRLFGVGVQPVVHVSPHDGNGRFGEAAVVSVNRRGKVVEGRRPSLSHDGRYVAYDSIDAVRKLVDHDRRRDVYVRDMSGDAPPVLASTTRKREALPLLSYLLHHLLPGQRFGHAYDASLSADGARVAFTAEVLPTDGLVDKLLRLGQDRPPPAQGVFLRDLDDAVTLRGDVASAGEAGNGDAGGPALSADGRVLAFHSAASNLAADDSGDAVDVFTRDFLDAFTAQGAAPAIHRLSVDAAGGPGNKDSTFPAASRDGRYVALRSEADNLVGDDTNERPDVFLRDQLFAASLTPTPLDFGALRVNVTSRTETATLRNDGRAPIDVRDVTVTGQAAGDFDVVSTTCPGARLEPGATCTTDLQFTPTAVGDRRAEMRITHSGPEDAAIGRLSGLGVEVDVDVVIDPDALDFGSRTLRDTSPQQTARVVNNGSEPVEITGITTTRPAGPDYQVVGTGCRGELAPRGSCGIDIEFTPFETGDRPAVLRVNHSGPLSPATARLTGTGTAAPDGLVLEPDPLAFGAVPVNTVAGPKTATLTNKRAGPVEVTGIAFTRLAGPDYRDARTTCDSLASGDSCTIDVEFTPSQEGARDAVLRVETSAGTATAEVTGAGAEQSSVIFRPAELDFGDRVVKRTTGTKTTMLVNGERDPVKVTEIVLGGPAASDYDIAATDCPGTELAPGASCTVDLQFTALEEGERSATVEAAHSGRNGRSGARLTGTGAPEPESAVTITPDRIDFGGVIIGRPSDPQRATVTNEGVEPVEVTGVTFTRPPGGDYRVIDTTCDNGPLAARGSCVIDIEFTPAEEGPRDAILRVDHTASDHGSVADVTGTGEPRPGDVIIRQDELDFGTRFLNDTSPPKTATVINIGDKTVDITGAAITGLPDGDYEVVGNNCGRLEPEATCAIDVEFTPFREGDRKAELEVRHTGSGATPAARLVGAGQAAPPTQVKLTPGAIDFGQQPVDRTAPPRSARVTNEGTVPAEITDVRITRRDGRDFDTDNGCRGVVLAPGDSCAIQVEFTPSEPAARDAILRVAHTASDAPATSHVTGTGVLADAELTFDPPRLDFGDQVIGVPSPRRPITVTNGGNHPVDIDDLRPTGPASSDYQVTDTTCRGLRLDPGDRCTANVRFVPTTDGDRLAELTVDHSGANSPAGVDMTGTGTRDDTSDAVLVPALLDFGSRTVNNTSPTQRTTLTNRGSAPLTVDEVTITGPANADYDVMRSTCPGVRLEPGSSCTVDMAFTPITTGRRAARLGVSHSAPDGGSAANLTGTGLAPSEDVTLQPDPLKFGNQVATTHSRAREATLTNRGSEPIDVRGVTITRLAGPDYRVTRTTCRNVRLSPGDSCTVSVRFTPATLGTRRAALRVAHSGTDGASAVALIGVGTPTTVPGLVAQPNPADLGEAPLGIPSQTTRITLTSTGTRPVNISALRMRGEHADDFLISATTCRRATLPTGAICTVDVAIKAVAVGDRRAVLRVDSTAPDTPLRTRVTGKGLPPELTIDPEIGPTGFVPLVKGEGFPPGESVPLRWRFPDGPDIPGTATARVRDDGTFEQQLLVFPKSRLGPREAITSDERWGDLTAEFLVVPGSLAPPLFTSRN